MEKIWNIIAWPFRAIYKLYFFLFFLVTLTLFYPLFSFFLANPKRFRNCFKIMKFWSFLLQFFGGIILLKKQNKGLPKEPYIVCANHASYFDIILMYRTFSEYFVFMGKREIETWPMFNIFFTKGMNILVDRENAKDGHNSLVEAGKRLDNGENVVIYPEGGIPNSAPRMIGFKNGAFKLAIEKQVPIVPVTFTNNWGLLQGSILLKGKAGPGFTKAIIHNAVSTKGLTEKDITPLKQQVFETIKAPIQHLQ